MAAIRTEHLSKEYRTPWLRRRIVALDDLNLEVEEGEIFGFIGPNGAGKTTTIKLLLGLLYPTRGKAWIFDKSIYDVSVKKDVGFLPENPYFYDYLTGEEILFFMGQLYGISRSILAVRVYELLDLVGLAEAQDLPLSKYSKGMLQRIGLAQALLADPKLVILDEPLSGLDPVGRKEMRDVIANLRKQGKTVFFSTHILSDAELLCDRVGILLKGKLTKVGRLTELLSPKTKGIEIVIGKINPALKESLEKVGPESMVDQGTQAVLMIKEEHKINEILELIRIHQGQLISLMPQKETLEEIFMREVGRIPIKD